ncbi:MAG: hypothetical protein EBW73_09115 [Betaproteobacteria bacterium]|nr:hypothetical protein [Betaproteobacteria bacterium]NCX12963.1 hypothetical protein [Betaproteobacteria bacterium]NDA35680.1 hypothetical protein [Betaproteobacteria bacterium]NDH30826.1 hypothetical protein [Betaproteobacteria bacterium]
MADCKPSEQKRKDRLVFDWLKNLFSVNPCEDVDEKKRKDDGHPPFVNQSANKVRGDCDGGSNNGSDGNGGDCKISQSHLRSIG